MTEGDIALAVEVDICALAGVLSGRTPPSHRTRPCIAMRSSGQPLRGYRWSRCMVDTVIADA